MTTGQLYWAAGVYEGEGNVYANAKGLQVKISQADPWLAPTLQDIFGGSICRSYPKAPRKPRVDWRICGVMAVAFLIAIYPLLSPRRKGQIDAALALWRTKRPWSGQEKINR